MHENATSVSKTNNISNKRLDVIDGVEIPHDRVWKHHVVVLCYKDSIVNLRIHEQRIRATHRTTNEVKFLK